MLFIGGGTGAPELLVALRDRLPESVCSIVVPVTDTGRSTGVIRRVLGIPAPGDLRHCLTTLAGSRSEWGRTLERRLRAPPDGGFDGMAVGNLVLGALTQETGNIGLAAGRLSSMLGVAEQVLPVSLEDIHLSAELEDGTRVHGEYEVRRPGKQAIRSLFIEGQQEGAWEPVRTAIEEATHCVLGPGSLWTSLGAVLEVRGIREALATSSARILFVCNTTTQPGQTDGLDFQGHIGVVTRLSGRAPDVVLANTGQPEPDLEEDLALHDLHMVYPPAMAGQDSASVIIGKDFLARSRPDRDWQKLHTAYHDMNKVAAALVPLIQEGAE
ncbi:MAG TPA: gluconeogenesis factor YvcK family protein [Chloroflexota bacterium]|nr:gluconeogenesis factor YvcK family protein [Chloroflexota bacterium]